MNPTDPLFLWLVRIALATLLIALVVCWGRLAGKRFLAVAGRVTSLLLVMVLSASTLFTSVNAQYGWFTSWQDVKALMGDTAAPPDSDTGGDPGAPPPQTAPPGAVLDPAVEIPPSRRPLVQLTTLPTAGVGGAVDVTVPGPISGYTGTVTVWLPPSYASSTPDQTFPVLEVFHGYFPAPRASFNVMHIDSIVHNLAAQQRLREPIIIVPHWAPGKVDTECVDGGGGPGRPQIETWLAQDVPAWIYTHLKAASGRASWATFGYSAGGWCALMATALHPQTYSTALSLGGYARPAFDPPYIPFQQGSPQWRRYDLPALAATKPPAISTWMLTAKGDDLSYPSSAELARVARPPWVATLTTLPTGGHSVNIWQPYVERSLAWLGQTAPGFKA